MIDKLQKVLHQGLQFVLQWFVFDSDKNYDKMLYKN